MLQESFPCTPLRNVPQSVNGHRLWVKDESACPTGTFKDRLGWALAQQVQRHCEPGLVISCITLGNTLISISRFFKELDQAIRPLAVGVFPEGFSNRVIGPDTSGSECTGGDILRTCEAAGAVVFEVDLATKYLTEQEIHNHVKSQLGAESVVIRDVTNGIGEPAYAPILEEALSLMDGPPSVILVPVGAGVLYEECISVIESMSLPTVIIGVSVTDPSSIADKIYGFYSPYFAELQQTRRATHPRFPRHYVISVSEQDILGALGLAKEIGYSSEPSAAAALVPLSTASTLPAGPVLWINSGNGIQYVKGAQP